MTELELNELEVGDFVISPMGGVIDVRSVTTKTPKHGAEFKEVRLRNVRAALSPNNPLLSRYQSCKALKARATAAADWINANTEYRVNDVTADHPLSPRTGLWLESNGRLRNAVDLINLASALGYRGEEVDANA